MVYAGNEGLKEALMCMHFGNAAKYFLFGEDVWDCMDHQCQQRSGAPYCS